MSAFTLLEASLIAICIKELTFHPLEFKNYSFLNYLSYVRKNHNWSGIFNLSTV